MATNLQIDDHLLNRARKVGGFRTKKETVNEALAEFLRRREQRGITDLFGTVDFTPGFDYKNLRAKR
jgi:Arc/MetJ family transcription regulator